MSLKFNDGMEFDTQTDLHIERRSDGYYVVGNGMLIPIDSYEEGVEIINREKEKEGK